jgi:hypothetical protein
MTITLRTTFEVDFHDDTTRSVEADLRYDPADPYAVAIAFHTSPKPVEWRFARDLLTDGLVAPAGDGDIRVRPGGTSVFLELRAPTGSATLSAKTDDVVEFLTRTYEIVSPGLEDLGIDFDRELAKITADH